MDWTLLFVVGCFAFMAWMVWYDRRQDRRREVTIALWARDPKAFIDAVHGKGLPR